MESVGQTVPHGNAGVLGQILNNGLLEAPVLDAVIHPAQDLSGVRQGLLLSHLRGARIQEGNAHAQIPGADLKRAAGTGGGLLEQQDDLLAGEPHVLHAVILHALEFAGQIQQVVDLLRCVVQQSQEASSSNIDAHCFFLLVFYKIGISAFFSNQINWEFVGQLRRTGG